MLNLVRVELGKLFRSKGFWITVLVYAVSISATFISLRYANALSTVDFSPEVQTELLEGIGEINDLVGTLFQSDNFVEDFYRTSSGHAMLLMVFTLIFILSDFSSRTLQSTLLSGYSRPQVYASKLLCAIVGSWVFYALSMVTVFLIGLLFYDLRLNLTVAGTSIRILLAQCAASVQYVAVFTAFAFCFGNGWAFPASIGFFLVLPGLPLALAFLQGNSLEFVTSYLPSFIGVNGLEGFVTMDMMLAQPALWSSRFVLPAGVVWLVVTTASTALGLYRFGRKQL